MLYALLVAALVALVVVGAFCLATRIVYGFSWKAILGLKREVNRGHITYVSRAMFSPTAVFWLGDKEWQIKKVAEAMQSGEIKRQDFSNAVSPLELREAVARRVNVWPSYETKMLFGKPEDVSA